MHSPVDAIMGIAGGAIDLVKKVMGPKACGTDFDDQLKAVMNETLKAGKTSKEKFRAAKGGMKENMQNILEDPRATQVFQHMAALKSLGLNKEDAMALLTGQGGLSDDGVRSVLKALGIGGDDLAQLMADPDLLAGLKASITQSVSSKFLSEFCVVQKATSAQDISNEALKALMSSGGLDEAQIAQLMADPAALAGIRSGLAGMVAQAAADVSDEDLKAILAAFGMKEEDIAGFMSDQGKVSGLRAKLAEVSSSLAGLHVDGKATGTVPDVAALMDRFDTLNAVISQFIASKNFPKGNTKGIDPHVFEAVQAAIAQDASEIKESVSSYLASQGKAGLLSGSIDFMQEAGQPGPEASSVQNLSGMVDTLEKTLNIQKKTLEDILFSSDPKARLAAADEAASSIGEYLKANAGKELPKEITDALGLLKGAMTSDEFAGIEKALKASSQDPAHVVQGLPFDRQLVHGLAKTLGAEGETARAAYTQQVIDQIRQALPSGMKAGEGSMTLKLNPPMLGRVDVDIRMQDGQILATFKADQGVTRDILQQNMHLLKDALSDAGIKAAQFVVSADSFNSREHREAYAAWAGFEQHRGGSSRQGHDPETASPGNDHDEYGQAHVPLSRYGTGGSLDIIA